MRGMGQTLERGRPNILLRAPHLRTCASQKQKTFSKRRACPLAPTNNVILLFSLLLGNKNTILLHGKVPKTILRLLT